MIRRAADHVFISDEKLNTKAEGVAIARSPIRSSACICGTLLAFQIGANSERKFVLGNDSSSLVASFIPAGHGAARRGAVRRSARATPRAR